MSTLALTLSGDLDISTGNLRVERDPAKALVIKLNARFKLNLGEWYLDTRIGVPWFQFVIGLKNPDVGVLRQMLRQVLVNTPGIASVDTLEVDFNDRTRIAQFSFRVTTDTNAVITGGSGAPFIVERS